MEMTVREYLTAIRKASTTVSIGGQLTAEDANTFIHTTLDQTGFLGRVTRQQVTAATANVDILSIAARIMRAATEDTEFTTTTAPTIARRVITKTSVKTKVRITDEFLMQNIEGPNIDPVLQGKFAEAFGNDIEDLSVNGNDDGVAGFIDITDGWVQLMIDDGSVNDVNAASMGTDFMNQIFPTMLRAMPNKWKANKAGLAYVVSPDMAERYQDQLASRETPGGDKAVQGDSSGMTKFRGITVEEHPYMPDGYAFLTRVANLVYGYGLLMSRESERKPAIGLGATDHYINSELDFQYGISDAIVLASNVNS